MASPQLWLDQLQRQQQQQQNQPQPPPYAQIQPQPGPQPPVQPQAQHQPQPQAQPQLQPPNPPIPLLPTDNSTYTFLARLVSHTPFPSAPRVLLARTAPTTFACCVISETGTGKDAGPTVLVAAQEGESREEAMQKMIGVLEEMAVKKMGRAVKWDEIRRKRMEDVVVTGDRPAR